MHHDAASSGREGSPRVRLHRHAQGHRRARDAGPGRAAARPLLGAPVRVPRPQGQSHQDRLKPGSCGVPSPGIIIKFLNVENATEYMPIGERGELCIGGANVMKGYWKNPDATAAIMTADGFMRTGDVGYM